MHVQWKLLVNSSSTNSILCIKILFGIISDQKLNILHWLQTIVKGLIKMSILKTKIAALKIKWVTKLLDSNFHPWKIIPNLLFSDLGGTRTLFHENLQLSKQCLAKIKQYPTFYYELIQIWAKASGKEPPPPPPPRTSEICEEVLWNNKMITFNGDSLFNKHFILKGVLTIRDIIDEYGVPLSWQDAQQKYSLNSCHIFHWYGLIKSIPTTWKDELQRNIPHSSGNIRNEHCIITSKIAYQRLLKPITKPPTAQNSLIKLLGLTDINWKKVYMLPRQATIEQLNHLYDHSSTNFWIISCTWMKSFSSSR